MSLPAWSPLDPRESPVLSIDMADPVRKQGGGSVVSCIAACVARDDDDPSAAAIIPGPCTVSGGMVVSVQKAANTGLPGKAYIVTFTYTLDSGPVLVAQGLMRIRTGGV